MTNIATRDEVQRQPITSDFKPRPALLQSAEVNAPGMITARSVRFMSTDSSFNHYEPEVPQEVAYTNFTPAEGASNAGNSIPERKSDPL